jgi:hypothetical protein
LCRENSIHCILAQLSRIQTLAKKYAEVELDAEIDDIRELFAQINRKFESACASRGIELPYPG